MTALINQVRETLADLEHAIWAHWMNYMFSQGTFNPDGSWVMPPCKVKCWQRQMATPYLELPEAERESDLHQADKILALLTNSSALILSSRQNRAYQRHHDYYLRRFLDGQYLDPDFLQLRLALVREALGLVEPYTSSSDPNPKTV